MENFSLISVGKIMDSQVELSQTHYTLNHNDDGEEIYSNMQRRFKTIKLRPDETRDTLFTRLNKAETYVIDENNELVLRERPVIIDNFLAQFAD